MKEEMIIRAVGTFLRRAASRRAAAVALAALLLAPALALAANGWHPYDDAAFARAQKAGKTIFVSVHADW